jgi:hypothetical protein
MPQTTDFAVLLFSRTEEGDFLAEATIEVRSAEQAKATAARMEGPGSGAVAFSKTGDAQLGEWQDAVWSLPAMATCRMISRLTHRIEGL